jgi:hypothetical protein
MNAAARGDTSALIFLSSSSSSIDTVPRRGSQRNLLSGLKAMNSLT